MNYEKNLAELDKRIECKKRELSELQRTRRELKTAEINKNKKPTLRGRPKINEEILIKAVKLAGTKTLNDVCFKLNISRSTLYKHGITRRALGGYRIGSDVIYKSKDKA